MSWFRKYYENRRRFVCAECGQRFILSFWQWLWAPHIDPSCHRYVKCPHCGVKHWLKAEEVIK